MLGSGCSPGHARTPLVAAVPLWWNSDAVAGDTLAYRAVKAAAPPLWQELENSIKSQQAQYILDSLD